MQAHEPRKGGRRRKAAGANSKGIAGQGGREGGTREPLTILRKRPQKPSVRTTFPIYARQRETNLQRTPLLIRRSNPRFILAYRHRKKNAGEMLCRPTPSSLILPLTHGTNDSTRVHTDGRNRRPQPRLQLRGDARMTSVSRRLQTTEHKCLMKGDG